MKPPFVLGSPRFQVRHDGGFSLAKTEVAMRSLLLQSIENDIWRVVKLVLAVAGLGVLFIILLIIT